MEDRLPEFVHVFVSTFLRLRGGVLYCNRGPRPAFRHDGHVIAANVALPVSGSVRHIAAEIPAGDFPLDVVPDFLRQVGVVDIQVRHDVVPGPADVLDVSFRVRRIVLRPHILRRMAVGHGLALEAGEGGRLKHILRVPLDRHDPLRVSIQHHLPGQIVLRPCPGNGDIVTD